MSYRIEIQLVDDGDFKFIGSKSELMEHLVEFHRDSINDIYYMVFETNISVDTLIELLCDFLRNDFPFVTNAKRDILVEYLNHNIDWYTNEMIANDELFSTELMSGNNDLSVTIFKLEPTMFIYESDSRSK